MPSRHKGWSWFDRDQDEIPDANEQTNLPDTEKILRRAYARCFSGSDGDMVLKHLHSLTLDRAFGPETSTDILRHAEGQRQLVAYIKAQYQRGREGT